MESVAAPIFDHRGHAAFEHLCASQGSGGANFAIGQIRALFGHLAFTYPDFFANVVAKAALENFQQMRVGIDQPRNDQLTGAVNPLLDVRRARSKLSANHGYHSVLNEHLPSGQNRPAAIGAHQRRVFE